MSGLLRNPVNPLNASVSPAFAATAAVADDVPPFYDEAPDHTAQPQPTPSNPGYGAQGYQGPAAAPGYAFSTPAATPVYQAPAAAVPGHAYPQPVQAPEYPQTTAVPAQYAQPPAPANRAVAPVFSGDDGFGAVAPVTYGAYPRLKLESGVFWLDGQKLGTEFLVQFIQRRTVLVYRDTTDSNDKNAKVVWSYDGVSTTKGESVEAILRQWKASGRTPAPVRETSEAIGMIQSEPHYGKVIMMSIPQQSHNRLMGYNNVLMQVHGKKANQVLTRVAVGEPVKFGNTSFTPWNFDLHAPLSQAA